MYEFIQTETGWLVCWGPLPVVEKKANLWQKLKENLSSSSRNGTLENIPAAPLASVPEAELIGYGPL